MCLLVTHITAICIYIHTHTYLYLSHRMSFFFAYLFFSGFCLSFALIVVCFAFRPVFVIKNLSLSLALSFSFVFVFAHINEYYYCNYEKNESTRPFAFFYSLG